MRGALFLFFALGFSFAAYAQTVQLSGTVKDAASRQPLVSCSVILAGSGFGTVTGLNGEFKLQYAATVPNPTLVVSYLGYQPDTFVIGLPSQPYNIMLKPADGILNEVTVTGVSHATLIKENPVSISVVNALAIEHTLQSNVIDALVQNVPGLNAVKTGPNISKPFIRGLGYNRVLTLYDGVRQEGQQWGDEHGIEADAYNLDKAEVIKGPSSLMFGSDALAGVVSLVPHLPGITDSAFYGRAVSEYQSNNGLAGNALRLGYSAEHFFVEAAGAYRIAKNYTNRIDGRVYNTGFREANMSLTASYLSAKGFTRITGTLYDNLQGIPDGSRDSLTRRFTQQVNESDSDDIKNRPVVSTAQLNAYKLSALHQHIQHYRIYATSNYTLTKGNIDGLLALTQNIRREYNHPTDITQPGMYVRLNTLNYSLRYNAPLMHGIEISGGVNGMYQNNKNINATDFPIPDYNLFDFGAFIYAKWKYRAWTLSGGLRYDVRYIRGADFYVRTNNQNGFARHVALPDTVGATLQFPAFKKIFNGLSFSIGATYCINNHVNLKLNIARGYRAPNITEFAANGLDPGAHIVYIGNRNALPEFSLQEDLSVTATYKHVSGELSLFNNNIEHYLYEAQQVDDQGNPLVIVPGNKTFQYIQASAQLIGLEASLSIHPTMLKGFKWNNSFSMVYGYNRSKSYRGEGTAGEYLPFIPPMRLLSSVNQTVKTKLKVLPAFHFMAEVDFSAAQNRFLALYGTETATPAFALLNASVSVDVNYYRAHTMQLIFQVNNVLDAAYQSNISRLKYFEYYSQSPNGKGGIYNMGRNICVRLILPF